MKLERLYYMTNLAFEYQHLDRNWWAWVNREKM